MLAAIQIGSRISGSTRSSNLLGSIHIDEGQSDMYEIHRKDTFSCNNCQRVLSYIQLYSSAKNIFYAGADDCGAMRILQAKGYKVEGIEESNWIRKNFCQDFLYKKQVEIGAIRTAANTKLFDLVLCISALENIPIDHVPSTLERISNLVKPSGDVFLVIASNLFKEMKSTSVASIKPYNRGKIKGQLRERSWWIQELSKHGLEIDKEVEAKFFEISEEGPAGRSTNGSYYNNSHQKISKLHRVDPEYTHDEIYCLKKSMFTAALFIE